MRRRLEQLRGLAPWEWRLLLGLFLLLPAIGGSLRLLGFVRTQNLIERLGPTPPVRAPEDGERVANEARRIAHLVGVAARHGPYRATCLRQSLALLWLLRRRGIASRLRLGGRMDNGRFRAHAWVEQAGSPLDPASGGYAPFEDLRARAEGAGSA